MSDAFDDAFRRCCPSDLRQFKACFFEKIPKLLLETLPPAGGQNQHFEIDKLAEIRPVARAKHVVDEKQRSLGAHDLMAVTKDLDCMIVVPVVDHQLQQIGVATFRN